MWLFTRSHRLRATGRAGSRSNAPTPTPHQLLSASLLRSRSLASKWTTQCPSNAALPQNLPVTSSRFRPESTANAPVRSDNGVEESEGSPKLSTSPRISLKEGSVASTIDWLGCGSDGTRWMNATPSLVADYATRARFAPLPNDHFVYEKHLQPHRGKL
jgi:hypothetical protein